jgi:hypothetical protein
MKKLLIVLLLSLLCSNFTLSQNSHALLKNPGLLNDKIAFNTKPSPLNKEEFGIQDAIYIFIFTINPMLVYENKKVNFGLTKEFSLAFPFFRVDDFRAIFRPGVEYSYIFRDERNHHLRSFLGLDIPIQSGEFSAVTFNFGGGYFTDFKKNGIFPQASLNMLVPVTENLAVNPYIKLRHTFMLKKDQTDNTDISIGVGIIGFSIF